jgi:hypothetical protein
MTEWYYITTPVPFPELKGLSLLDELMRVEHLDTTLSYLMQGKQR